MSRKLNSKSFHSASINAQSSTSSMADWADNFQTSKNVINETASGTSMEYAGSDSDNEHFGKHIELSSSGKKEFNAQMTDSKYVELEESSSSIGKNLSRKNSNNLIRSKKIINMAALRLDYPIGSATSLIDKSSSKVKTKRESFSANGRLENTDYAKKSRKMNSSGADENVCNAELENPNGYCKASSSAESFNINTKLHRRTRSTSGYPLRSKYTTNLLAKKFALADEKYCDLRAKNVPVFDCLSHGNHLRRNKSAQDAVKSSTDKHGQLEKQNLKCLLEECVSERHNASTTEMLPASEGETEENRYAEYLLEPYTQQNRRFVEFIPRSYSATQLNSDHRMTPKFGSSESLLVRRHYKNLQHLQEPHKFVSLDTRSSLVGLRKGQFYGSVESFAQNAKNLSAEHNAQSCRAQPSNRFKNKKQLSKWEQKTLTAHADDAQKQTAVCSNKNLLAHNMPQRDHLSQSGRSKSVANNMPQRDHLSQSSRSKSVANKMPAKHDVTALECKAVPAKSNVQSECSMPCCSHKCGNTQQENAKMKSATSCQVNPTISPNQGLGLNKISDCRSQSVVMCEVDNTKEINRSRSSPTLRQQSSRTSIRSLAAQHNHLDHANSVFEELLLLDLRANTQRRLQRSQSDSCIHKREKLLKQFENHMREKQNNHTDAEGHVSFLTNAEKLTLRYMKAKYGRKHKNTCKCLQCSMNGLTMKEKEQKITDIYMKRNGKIRCPRCMRLFNEYVPLEKESLPLFGNDPFDQMQLILDRVIYYASWLWDSNRDSQAQLERTPSRIHEEDCECCKCQYKALNYVDKLNAIEELMKRDKRVSKTCETCMRLFSEFVPPEE